jgi:DNA-binding SARP family transcriptional activator
MLTLCLLGQLSVQLDGASINVCRRPKSASLLGYLLLHQGQPIPRDRLAFDLWPDVPEPEARANLRRHLYHLRRALPDPSADMPWALIKGRTLQWNPSAECWVDVVEFERLVQADETLEGAISLYRGDLLPDAYDDWLFYERDRLQTLYLSALSRLVLYCRSQRNDASALAYAQELLRWDPFREDALRQLMLLYYETGNRASALAENVLSSLSLMGAGRSRRHNRINCACRSLNV